MQEVNTLSSSKIKVFDCVFCAVCTITASLSCTVFVCATQTHRPRVNTHVTHEDLIYEHSVQVGDTAPRILYQGRDFQYYFSLPQGDPNDDFRGTKKKSTPVTCAILSLSPTNQLLYALPVNIYTEIRSAMDGTVTKPCPVTVRVLPSFLRDSATMHLDPELEL